MKVSSVSILVLLPMAVSAQALQDPAPLKYWPAPLYWQPTHAESRTTARPELFSASPQTSAPSQASPNSLLFVAMTPCRLVDTRAGFGFTGFFGPPSLVGGATRVIPVQTSTTCTIPPNAQAYSLNVTVAPPAAMYYLTIWPFGSGQPNVSTLNDLPGTVIANAAIVPAGNDSSGSVIVFVSNNTDLIVDINGYYAPQTNLLNDNTGIGAGTLANDTTGGGDTATGFDALLSNTTGFSNTANGGFALQANTIGNDNTATGFYALYSNTTGGSNTADGSYALQHNTTGGNNTATGQGALQYNTTGGLNTANGYNALVVNTTGSSNTATGVIALNNNTTGSYNTADGINTLVQNATGNYNTAVGGDAMYSNSTGIDSTATGYNALTNTTTGNNNTATGAAALYSNTTGSNNIAIGVQAAAFVSGGNSNNIHIGSTGLGGDNATIRVGDPNSQTSFFAAGIRGVTTGMNNAVPVVIDSNGQLGTVNSSSRFKEDVHDMAGASDGLLRLRPVTYRYRQPYADGSKPIDYGLIAEEVAEVYPDLVVKGSDGQVETVQYQKLTPMLLNELQKEHQRGDQQSEAIRLLQTEVAELKALLSGNDSARR